MKKLAVHGQSLKVTVHGDFEKCRLSTWFVAEVVRLRFYLFVQFPNSHESGYNPWTVTFEG